MRGLELFLSAIGAPETTEGKSTSQVSLQLLELTADALGSFCDLHAQSPEITGPSTVFISHSWSMQFNSLVDVLRDVLQRDGGFAWFDLLSNNQHTALAKEFSWWATVFRSNVRSIGHTVLVLEFDDPKPLRRAWCLFEIACSTLGGMGGGASDRPPVRFEICMPPSSRAGFERALADDFDSLLQRTCSVDVALAEAYHGGECRRLEGGCPIERRGGECPSDKARIMSAVTSWRGGTNMVNERIADTMRAWMAASGRAALENFAEGDVRLLAPLQLQYLKLLLELGRSAEAEADLVAVVAASRRVRGEEHVATLDAMSSLCKCYMHLLRYDDTAELMEKVLALQLRSLGPDAAAVTQSRLSLAQIFLYTKRSAHCEALLDEVLASAERRVAAGDAAALASPALIFRGNLASRRGDSEASSRFAAAASEAFHKALGDRHPSTWMCDLRVHRFSVMIPTVLEGRESEYDAVFAENLRLLQGTRARVGATHNVPLFCAIYLMGCMLRTGRGAAALPLARDIVECYEIAKPSESNYARNFGQALKMLSLLLPKGSGEQLHADMVARAKLAPIFKHRHALKLRPCMSIDEGRTWLGLCDMCRWSEAARPYLSCDECGIDICPECVRWFAEGSPQ